VNQNQSKSYIWQDPSLRGGLKIPVGNGSRLIVCHADSDKYGFWEGVELGFQGKKINSSTDNHHEMNGDIFKEWFIDMLKNLEEGSLIVMDNASYHSMYREQVPNTKKS